MKCDRARSMLHDTRGLLVGALLGLHLARCPACRAEAAQVSALDSAVTALPRLTPSPGLLPKLLDHAQADVSPGANEKGRRTMRRLGYASAFLVILAAVAAGLLIVPARPSGASLLVQAAYAMGASDTFHVRGDRNLADEYSGWNPEPGRYEFWYSPEGFRQDWYDKDGNLVRSLGGTVAAGKAWQYFPGGSSGKGTLFVYDVGSEPLTAYVQVNRDRFSNGQLRLAEIAERGHKWAESTGEWEGRTVTVVEEQLGPALVSGEPRGTMEYYLDRESAALLGMAQYGSSEEGRPLKATVDLIEYDVEVPMEVFEPAAPTGAEAETGQFAIRPTGDIAFYPGAETYVSSLLGAALEHRHNATMGIASWEEAERSYLHVLEEDPNNFEARLHLGRMYTRWGLFDEALEVLPPGDSYWSDLNRAFCLDALGRRQDAVAIYERLKGVGHDSVAEWAKLGLERPTWPHDLDIKPVSGEFLLKPRPEWRAWASGSSAETTPQAAIDGDRMVRWSNGGAPDDSGQAPGQWFQLDFGSPVSVSRVVLDHYGVKSFYTNDWPRGVKASYTSDGANWLSADVSQAGPMQPATVCLNPPAMVRSIRFELTQSHSPEWWSMHEIYVFAPAR